jgi:plasmid stabilization system protein ParE
MRIRVTKRADGQIDQAASWWEQNRPHAPGAVDEELAEAFLLLSTQPDIGVPALNTKTKDVKRVLLARIHYWLYYRVRRDEIQILALWHTSRGGRPGI